MDVIPSPSQASDPLLEAFDSLPGATVLVAPTGRIKLWNRAAAALFTLTAQEAVGGDLEALAGLAPSLSEGDVARALSLQGHWAGALLARVQGRGIRLEARLSRQRDGHLLATFTAQAHEALTPPPIGQEESPRALLEDALGMFRNQLDALFDGMQVLDAQGHVVWQNARFFEVLGRRESDFAPFDGKAMLADALQTVVDPDGFLQRIGELLADPRAVATDLLEFRDGRRIERYTAGLWSPDGAYLGRLWSFRDVTDRYRVEADLRRGHALAQTQQEVALDGMLIADETPRVVGHNRRFREIWGVSEADMSSGDPQRICKGFKRYIDDIDSFFVRVNQLYADPQAFGRDELRLNDGRVLDRYSAPMHGKDGSYYGRIWYYRDITERIRFEETLREQNERLEALHRLKTDFVHSVSHELRTPLTAVMGYAEFLEESLAGSGRPEQSEFVTEIQHGTRRLKHLVDDLLDFALLEAGSFQLKRCTADLCNKVRAVANAVRPQLERAGLTLALTLPDVPLTSCFDPQRIEQVLMNMLVNAIQHTPAGGTLRVRAWSEEGRLFAEVEDSGPGIPEADLPRLFQRFSQLEGGRRRGGAGLGLSISRALVEAHGGELGVASMLGQGARFYFWLPIGDCAEVADPEEPPLV